MKSDRSKAVVYVVLVLLGFAILGFCHWRFEGLTTRVVNLVFAGVFLVLAAVQMKTGRMNFVTGEPFLTKEERPAVFWGMNILLIAISIVLIVQKVLSD